MRRVTATVDSLRKRLSSGSWWSGGKPNTKEYQYFAHLTFPALCSFDIASGLRAGRHFLIHLISCHVYVLKFLINFKHCRVLKKEDRSFFCPFIIGHYLQQWHARQTVYVYMPVCGEREKEIWKFRVIREVEGFHGGTASLGYIGKASGVNEMAGSELVAWGLGR